MCNPRDDVTPEVSDRKSRRFLSAHAPRLHHRPYPYRLFILYSETVVNVKGFTIQSSYHSLLSRKQ